MKMDLTSKVSPEIALNIQAISSSTTTAGNIIDSKGFNSADISLITGTITDGTYTVTIVSGNAVDNVTTPTTITDATAVAADFIIGTLPSFTLPNDDNLIKHFGYIGKDRWFQISVVSAGVTTGGTLGSQVTLGNPVNAPTA